MDLANGCLYCHSEQSWPSSRVRQFLYQRFAPRLIDLVRTRRIDAAFALRAFGPPYANLAAWPDDERRATEDALGAALVEAVARWSSSDLVDLLGGLACAYDDLRPWLARLDAATGPAAQRGAVRLACQWATDLLWGADNWFPWWFIDDPVTPVRDWTLGRETEVEQFSEAHPGCKTAHDALIAYDRLEHGENSPWWCPGYAWDQWGLPGQYGWLTDGKPAAADA